MKYIIIIYIAFGLILSSAVGIEYSCEGREMFPEYTGSPFVFRQKSLGSSMTHYYSITGLIFNTVVWTALLMIAHQLIKSLMERSGSGKRSKRIYTGAVVVLALFTTLNIGISYMMLGRGFGKGLNYWYFDLDEEAKDWGAECKGKWGMFRLPN